ncbi:MAG: hypothetical protein IJB71_04365 [Bacilli bacterium]|nr:hypothetical protein [Bacilli bacterium]
MKNKQKKAQKSYLYIIFLALAFIILLGTGAYAYYQTTITGTITGNVAKWSFKANNQTSTFNIDFGQLYPGKSAEYSIELSAEDSDLPVGFLLIFNLPHLEGDDTNNLVLPDKDLVIYNYTHLYQYYGDPYDDSHLLFLPGMYGGIYPGEKVTIPLYYDWPYEFEGFANGQNITSSITVIGRQLEGPDMDTAFSSLMQFMDDHLNSLSCTNGSYSYPNKYGFPCSQMPLRAVDLTSLVYQQEGGLLGYITTL